MPPCITTLADIVQAEFAHNTACILPESDISLTYTQLADRRDSLLVPLVDLGCEHGSVVIIRLMNGIEFLSAFLAVVCLGGIALPVNPAQSDDELRFAIRQSRAKAVIADSEDQAAISVAEGEAVEIGLMSI